MTDDPARDYRQQRWTLGELLPDATEEAVAPRLREAEAAVAAFEAQRPNLSGDMEPAVLLGIVGEYEALIEKLYVLGAYGSLWFAEDTQDADALAYKSRIEHVLTGFQNRLLFFDLWWKGLEDVEAERLLPDAEVEPDLRHFLLDMRRLKPFTLDEGSEQLINIKDANGISALVTMYSMLTNRLEFDFEVEGQGDPVEGETRKLTRAELMSYVYS